MKGSVLSNDTHSPHPLARVLLESAIRDGIFIPQRLAYEASRAGVPSIPFPPWRRAGRPTPAARTESLAPRCAVRDRASLPPAGCSPPHAISRPAAMAQVSVEGKPPPRHRQPLAAKGSTRPNPAPAPPARPATDWPPHTAAPSQGGCCPESESSCIAPDRRGRRPTRHFGDAPAAHADCSPSASSY